MKDECCCGLNLSDLVRGTPYKDLGFHKIICAKCGKEFITDKKDITDCFECERRMQCKK